ncbi:MAG: hypothetical protein FJ221_08775 [Lentisphaerae bacterium]|nr:hypothetical protein [Lentisphaerota bacterium]
MKCGFSHPGALLLVSLIAATAANGATAAPSPHVLFPDDPCVIDAKRHLGAKGDGRADDTAALQAGLDASCRGASGSGILYLPNGTYRVTRTLVARHGVGPWVYGESRDGVVIRMDDGAASSNVTAVLRTHPNDGQATSADYFMRNFRNLTVDAGDNPSLDGIRWFGNNSSILQDVRVVGNGRVGINAGFCGQSGPNLIQDAVVEGFETGISSAWIWGQTLSRVRILNCRSNAVYVSANSVAIEDLTVENTPVAIRNDYPKDWTWWGGVVALVGGAFTTEDSPRAAIENRSVLYARDVTSKGFAKAVESSTPGGNAEGRSLAEYLSHPPVRAFEASPAAGLRLPIKPEPRLAWETDPREWVCANDCGATFNDNKDDTAALQQAVDKAAETGATTVYLRGVGGPEPNWYNLGGEVRIHGSVRHVIGLGFGRILGGPEGRFVVDDRSAPVVKFQHLQAFGGRGLTYENRSGSRAMVVESCDGLILGTGGGDIFVTDCPSGIELRSPKQRAWARQLNPEGTSDIGLVRNHGGKLWVLGVKHEGAGVRFWNDNGGQTEVFGMFNYGPGVSADDSRPIVHNDNSAFCLMGAREIVFGGHTFPVKVREIRGPDVRPVEGGGWIGWAMYSGWTSDQLSEPPPAAWPVLRPDGDDFLDSVSVTGTTTTAGAVLRYTTDGSEPTADAPGLPSSLRVRDSLTLKVRAFAPGRPASATRSAAFRRLTLRPAEPGAKASGSVHYAYYELPQTAERIPDFARLQSATTGTVTAIDPTPRRREGHFALRFTGWFHAVADGLYTFHTTSDDGSRLWIGDRLVVDNDGLHAEQTRSGRIALQAGMHPFVVGFLQGGGEAVLRVEVEGPDGKRRRLGAAGEAPSRR